MTYPIKIKASANVIAYWQNSEQGSFEELGTSWGDPDPSPENPHVWTILTRHRTVIEIRNDSEALTLCESADWQGEGGRWDFDLATRRAIDRVADKILELTDEGLPPIIWPPGEAT